MTDIYQQKGFDTREDYLAALVETITEYMTIKEACYKVGTLAELLGEEEDFDGLISSLSDECECSFSELQVDNL